MQVNYKDTLSPQVHQVLNTLKQEAEKLFSFFEKHVLYSEATVLDPLFKNTGFSEHGNFERALAGLKTKVGLESPAAVAALPQQRKAYPDSMHKKGTLTVSIYS